MDTSQFSAAVRQRPGMAIVDLRGDIDAVAEHGLAAAYDEAAAPNPEVVLLNFGAVGYINSTGIALIVGILARARKDGRRVTACGLSAHYQEIFQITRLSDFMHMFPDEASAVAEQSAA